MLYASPRATVVWGDCRDPDVIARVPRYGLLCTDPPYGIRFRSRLGKNFEEMVGDDGSIDWPAVLAEWVGPEGTSSRGLTDHRHVYVFGYRPDQLAAPLRLGGAVTLVWDKVNIGPGDLSQPWGPAHEIITFGVHLKGRAEREAGRGRLSGRLRQGSVLRVPRLNGTRVNRHPTEKPLELMARLIESSSVHGDLVVDPCSGSGSTLVAAVLEGRRAWGVEIDRKYAELAVQRIRAAEAILSQIKAA